MKHNLILIDNDLSFIKEVSSLLEKDNWNVFVAHSNSIAIQLLNSHEIHVICSIILDQNINLFKLLTKEYKNKAIIPIIAIVGKSENERSLLEKALKQGINDFFLKENSLDLLIFRTDKSLENYKQNNINITLQNEILSIEHIQQEIAKKNKELEKIKKHLHEKIEESDSEYLKSELRFKKLIEFSNDLMMMVNFNGIIIYQSPSIKKTLGYFQQELIGKNILEYIHIEDREFFFNYLTKTLALTIEDNSIIEYRFKHKSENYIWLSSYAKNHLKDHLINAVVIYSRDITFTKSTKDASNLANFVIENSPVVLFRFSANPLWKVDYISENISQFGYYHQTILESNFRFPEFIHPDDQESFVSIVEDSIHTNRDSIISQFKIKHNFKEDVFWTSTKIQVTRDIDNKPRYFEGVLIDITGLKLLEQELMTLEEKNWVLVSAIPDSLVMLNSNGIIIDTKPSKELAPFLNGILGKHYKEGFPKEIAEEFEYNLGRLYSTGNTQIFEFNIQLGDRFLFYESRLVMSSKNKVLNIIRDITDKKETEEELKILNEKLEYLVDERTQKLKESEERYRTMVEEQSEFVIRINNKLEYVYANQAFCGFFQFKLEDIVGKKVSKFRFDRQKRLREKFIQQLIINGMFDSQIEYLKMNGKKVYVEWNIKPVYKDKKLKEFHIVGRDITYRKELEDQLQHAKKMEAIGNLAGGIAHDFNNLLQPIILNAELTVEKLKDDPNAESIVKLQERILKSSRRAKDIVGQILDFARQNNKVLSELNINSHLKEMIYSLESIIPKKIQLITNITTKQMYVMAESDLLYQLISNLVTNSYQAMEDLEYGTITISLEDFTPTEQDLRKNLEMKDIPYSLLKVKDTGCGIPEQIKSKIFEPFFTTKKMNKGTGLGLTIVYGIIKKFNGIVTIDSKINNGTTFNIYIPYLKSMNISEMEVHREDLQSQFIQSIEIIIIDDEIEIAESLKDVAISLGHNAEIYSESSKGLEQILNHPTQFDLILLDQIMPELKGTDIVSIIREKDIRVPVIICTGFDNSIDYSNFENVHVMRKPISKVDLNYKINSIFLGQ